MNAMIRLMEGKRGIELALPWGAILHCENGDLSKALEVCIENAKANNIDFDIDPTIHDAVPAV